MTASRRALHLKNRHPYPRRNRNAPEASGVQIVAFVGMAGSGKSEAAAVARELGLPVVGMGDAVREEAARRGLPETDASVGSLASRLREEEGPQAIAIRSIPKVRAANGDVAVVDGIRSLAEVEAFRAEFGDDLLLVRVDAPQQLRRQRLASRGRPDDPNVDLDARDARELGWGMGDVMAAADIALENSGTLDAIHASVRHLLGERLYDATVAVSLYPTEDAGLVTDAVHRFFPDARLESEGDAGGYELLSSSVSLTRLHRLLREQRILDTARERMLASRQGDEMVLHFNKQAACAGKVSFAADPGPLGTIALRMESPHLGRLVDWLAPRTEDGRTPEETEWP